MEKLTLEIWVPVVVFLIGHLGAAIWFASGLRGQIKYAMDDLKRLTEDVRELTADIKKLAGFEARIAVGEARFTSIEEQIREIRRVAQQDRS